MAHWRASTDIPYRVLRICIQCGFDSVSLVQRDLKPQVTTCQIRCALQQAFHNMGLAEMQRHFQPLLLRCPVQTFQIGGKFQRRPALKTVFPRNHMQKIGMFERAQIGARRMIGDTLSGIKLTCLISLFQGFCVTAQLV